MPEPPLVAWNREFSFAPEDTPVLLNARECTILASHESTIGMDPITGKVLWNRAALPLPGTAPIQTFDFGATVVLAQQATNLLFPGYVVAIRARTGLTIWSKELDIGLADVKLGDNALEATAFSGSPYRVFVTTGAIAEPFVDESVVPSPRLAVPDWSLDAPGRPVQAFRWHGGVVGFYDYEDDLPELGKLEGLHGVIFLRLSKTGWHDVWNGTRLRLRGQGPRFPAAWRVLGSSGDRIWVLAYVSAAQLALEGITLDGRFVETDPPTLVQGDYFIPADTNRGIFLAAGDWIWLYRNGRGARVRPCNTEDHNRQVGSAGLLKLVLISTATDGRRTFAVSLEPFGRLP